MRNRRPTIRNRGRITLKGGAPASPIVFWSQVTGASVIAAYQSDFGVTSGGGIVTQWNDLTGNGWHLTTTAGPSLNSAALNGFDTFTFNGTTQFLANDTLDLPAPLTTPTFWWFVFKQNSWTIGEDIMSTGGAGMRFAQSSTTPRIQQVNAASGILNAGAAIGSWVRGEILFTGSTNDYTKLGSTNTGTGTSCGNTNPTAGVRVACNFNKTTFSNFDLVALMLIAGTPSNLATLNTLVTNKYGVGVGV